MAKTWTINVLVNTRYIEEKIDGSGTWEEPVGAKKLLEKNVQMTAISDHVSDGIKTGTGDKFSLEVHPRDTIRWIVDQVNPLDEESRGVCMYGFKTGANWDSILTPLNARVQEADFVAMTKGFNDKSRTGARLRLETADISVPETTVRKNAKTGTVKYYMKILLLDTSKTEPEIMKYVQVDPEIHVTPLSQS